LRTPDKSIVELYSELSSDSKTKKELDKENKRLDSVISYAIKE
jgi:hypothetical protein